jgi:hypothetical protein
VEKPAETDRVAHVVGETLATWLSTGLANDAAEINRGAARGGCCEDFSSEVLQRLGDEFPEINAEDFSIVQFLKPGDDEGDDYGHPFDRALLRKHWKNVKPPSGTTWKEWDGLSAAAGFSPCTHVFLYSEGMFYDSECTNGTPNFLELPFFTRAMESWKEELEAASLPSP